MITVKDIITYLECKAIECTSEDEKKLILDTLNDIRQYREEKERER